MMIVINIETDAPFFVSEWINETGGYPEPLSEAGIYPYGLQGFSVGGKVFVEGESWLANLICAAVYVLVREDRKYKAIRSNSHEQS